jgi:hypothetical protein
MKELVAIHEGRKVDDAEFFAEFAALDGSIISGAMDRLGTVDELNVGRTYEFHAGDVIHVPARMRHAVRANRDSQVVSVGDSCPADIGFLRACGPNSRTGRRDDLRDGVRPRAASDTSRDCGLRLLQDATRHRLPTSQEHHYSLWSVRIDTPASESTTEFSAGTVIRVTPQVRNAIRDNGPRLVCGERSCPSSLSMQRACGANIAQSAGRC